MKTIEWDIYKEIKMRSSLNQWTSVQYLAEKFKICNREVKRHIQNIREEEQIQKIILTSYQKGYKLMSEKDEFELLTKEKSKIIKQFKRYWLNVKRYNLNNQTKLTFDTKERDFIESLIK